MNGDKCNCDGVGDSDGDAMTVIPEEPINDVEEADADDGDNNNYNTSLQQQQQF